MASTAQEAPGTLVEEIIVQPGTYGTSTVKKGQILRIIDVEGEQVADFCSWNLHDPSEYCNVIYTMCAKQGWKDFVPGDVIYTKNMNPLWTIVADTCGVHYWGGDFCSGPLNDFLGTTNKGYGCRERLEEALAEHGLSPLYLNTAACFNVFMNFPYNADGSWVYTLPVTKAGDHIDLRAEMDALWAVSCCHALGETNAANPTPLKFELYDLVG
jgi:uncharacterized protein